MSDSSSARLPRHVATILRSLIAVVCPDRGNGLDDDILASAAAFLQAAPRHIRLALFAGVVAYDLGAVAHPGVATRPAHRLSLADHQRYFHGWWTSPLMVQRELAKALKGFLALSYYEHTGVKERIGYTPAAWIDRSRRRRLTTYADAVAAHERALITPDPLPVGTFGARRGASPDTDDTEVSHAS